MALNLTRTAKTAEQELLIDFPEEFRSELEDFLDSDFSADGHELLKRLNGITMFYRDICRDMDSDLIYFINPEDTKDPEGFTAFLTSSLKYEDVFTDYEELKAFFKEIEEHHSRAEEMKVELVKPVKSVKIDPDMDLGIDFEDDPDSGIDWTFDPEHWTEIIEEIREKIDFKPEQILEIIERHWDIVVKARWAMFELLDKPIGEMIKKVRELAERELYEIIKAEVSGDIVILGTTNITDKGPERYAIAIEDIEEDIETAKSEGLVVFWKPKDFDPEKDDLRNNNPLKRTVELPKRTEGDDGNVYYSKKYAETKKTYVPARDPEKENVWSEDGTRLIDQKELGYHSYRTKIPVLLWPRASEDGFSMVDTWLYSQQKLAPESEKHFKEDFAFRDEEFNLRTLMSHAWHPRSADLEIFSFEGKDGRDVEQITWGFESWPRPRQGNKFPANKHMELLFMKREFLESLEPNLLKLSEARSYFNANSGGDIQFKTFLGKLYIRRWGTGGTEWGHFGWCSDESQVNLDLSEETEAKDFQIRVPNMIYDFFVRGKIGDNSHVLACFGLERWSDKGTVRKLEEDPRLIIYGVYPIPSQYEVPVETKPISRPKGQKRTSAKSQKHSKPKTEVVESETSPEPETEEPAKPKKASKGLKKRKGFKKRLKRMKR
jgi:hypothetical protein